MTLTLYRRHKKTCPNFGKRRNDKQSKCKCKIWADGIIEGREVRMSLDLRDWSKAERIKIRMEDGEPTEYTAAITLAHAWIALVADLEARKLSNQTIRKYKLLKRQMEA